MRRIVRVDGEACDCTELIHGDRATRATGALIAASARARGIEACELSARTAYEAMVNEVTANVFVGRGNGAK